MYQSVRTLHTLHVYCTTIINNNLIKNHRWHYFLSNFKVASNYQNLLCIKISCNNSSIYLFQHFALLDEPNYSFSEANNKTKFHGNGSRWKWWGI